MRPQSAKAKGRRYQQMVRDLIYKHNPELEEGDVESTSMGAGGVDIKLSPKARRLFPFSVECKNKETISVFKEFQQAQKNTLPKTLPVLAIKKNLHKPLAVLDLEAFIELVRKAYKSCN